MMEAAVEWLLSLCAIIVMVALLLNFLWGRQPSNYPPGPFAWPVIGNLLNVAGGDGFYANILNIRKDYGDIFRLKMGEMSMIVVFGYKNVREVLVDKGDIFKYRPNWLYIPTNVIKNKGIIWTNGEVWEKLVNLLKASQNDVTRQNNLEREILEEFKYTAVEIEQKNCQAFNPLDFVSRSVFNVICAAALGKRFDYDNPDFKELEENVTFLTNNSKTNNPVNAFPFIARLVQSKFEGVLAKEEKIFNLFREKIEEHKKSLDPQKPRDYIDLCLCVDPQEKSHDAYAEHNFLRSMIDFYLGGADTITSMFLWSLTYFVKYPDVQDKCREEMDRVVGKDNLVNGEHVDVLPYTSAAIKELRRVAGSIVLTALRTNTCDTSIGPYQIPKGSIIVLDIRQQHMDAEIWDDPTEFRPERFLEETDKPYHPFGLGPRMCPAQKIAETFLMLYLANIIHRFQLKYEKREEPIPLDSFYTDVSLRPKPANISFIRRD